MPGTTTYGVDLSVQLAVGRAVDAAVWGTSKWGQARWATADTALGDWLDVTCDVLDGLRLTAGSNTEDGVARRWESASAAFTLDGRQWDPWNGPHAGIIGDRTPVRVLYRTTSPVGAWAAAFTGYVATRGYSWDPGEAQADVQCVDGTSILVASDLVASPAAGAGELAGARVTRIAAAARWPGALDVTAGGTALQATTLDAPAWDELLSVADSDLGLLWVTRAGALAYRPRGRVGQGVTLAGRLVVCATKPGDVAVMTMGANQPSVTRNRVTISRKVDVSVPGDVPVPAQREDRESIARYQPFAFKDVELLHTSDAWSTTIAEAVLGQGAWPSPAPGQALLDTISEDPRVPAVLLGIEPDRTFDVVDDAGSIYRQAVTGWDVEVRHDSLEGLLLLEDVSRWTNVAKWGTGKWGIDRWGIGGI
ncbi:hypothetical protein [Cellulomonas sp. URHB0016]